MKVNKNVLILLGIVFLALLLRLYNLAGESLWMDESMSIDWAGYNPFRIVLRTILFDVHPPLYNTLLHYWIALFGDSEFSIRLPSAIFGVLSVAMIYKVGGLIFDKKTGLLSALILSFSLFHIRYSQEARMYALTVLLSLVSMYFFIKFLDKKDIRTSIAYILSTTVLLYTHYSGLLLLLAQNIYVAISLIYLKDKPLLTLRSWLLLQAVLITAYAPWVAAALYQIKRVQNVKFWIKQPTVASIMQSLTEYSGSIFLLVLFGGLASFAIFKYADRRIKIRRPTGTSVLLLTWFFIPIMVPFAISQFSAPLYVTKYTISGSLALYILAARGIGNIADNITKKVIIGIAIALSLMSLGGYYLKVDKPQWREAADFINKHAQAGDLLVFNDQASRTFVFGHYLKRKDLEEFPWKEKSPAPYTVPSNDNVKKLWSEVRDYGRIWVVLSHAPDNGMFIKKYFSDEYDLRYYVRYFAIEVFYLVKRKQ